MIIRAASPGDASAIADIWNQTIRDTSHTFTSNEKTEESLCEDITTRGAAFQVAVSGNLVLGFATFGDFRGGPGYAHTKEHSIILRNTAIGKGVGRVLLTRLEGIARDQGVHSLIAGISGENLGAIRFHKTMGYERVGRIPDAGRKFDRWIDLVLMQKIL